MVNFNPELTFGSIMVAATMFVSVLGLYFGIKYGLASVSEKVAALQAKFDGHVLKSENGALTVLAALADIRITDATISRDVDSIKERLKEHHDRINTLGDRQNSFIDEWRSRRAARDME